jgi:lipopolysaccharide transport system ATP-binding protein
MSTVIKAENISKQYRLGSVGTGSLVHDLNRTWQRIRGKEDPYLKIGETNDRTQMGSSEYVWALKDINFEVKQGEVLGIIGRNGAGKSTLLKILSRTTTPTTGKINIKGRIASLLEVGTGFHPELSGRENIFLNGAILGMTRHEIKSKFDEIVDFAGVERYIDTPVKRYSSGMYVRLAFGVAAHLEPEILIVDEVLAVGDAEFQKKALGKMKDVSGKEGRTVLFVSHNMLAVRNLCDSCVYMKNGLIEKEGNVEKIINEYLLGGNSLLKVKLAGTDFLQPNNEIVILKKAEVYSIDPVLKVTSVINIKFEFEILQPLKFNLSLKLKTADGLVVFNSISEIKDLARGIYISELIIPSRFLNDGFYYVDIFFVDSQKIKAIFSVDDVLSFSLEDERDIEWTGKWDGVIRPNLSFTIK